MSKTTALPDVDWDEEFGGADDIKGQVDFELAVRADSFVGSPFSSMSVLIAVVRQETRIGNSVMANIDVRDNMARIFGLQFQYDRRFSTTENPCSDLVQAHPAFSRHLSSCPMRRTDVSGKRDMHDMHYHNPNGFDSGAVQTSTRGPLLVL